MSNEENTPTTEAPNTLLVDLPVDSPQTALNVIISFTTIAQKRGAFTLQESAKLWDCIKFFTGSEPITQPKSAEPKCAETCAEPKCAETCAETSESNITLDVTEDGSAVVAPA
jgi:hypothetical protein